MKNQITAIDVSTGKLVDKKYFTGENPASIEYRRGFITKFVDWDYRSGQPQKCVRVQVWIKDSDCGEQNLAFDTFDLEYFGEWTNLDDIKERLNENFDAFGYSSMNDRKYLERCMATIEHEFPFFDIGDQVDTYNTDDVDYS